MTCSGQRQRICLNMIVKNEAHVIERCLASVRPWIDSWLIVDTGSTDGTQARIAELLEGKPGQLVERPWRNFGHNRSEAMDLARPHGDYILIIDADQVLEVADDFAWPPLSADAYALQVRFDGTEYALPWLVASRLPWSWQGVLHEYLDAGQTVRSERLPGLAIRVYTDGARSQDPEKFAKDEQLLEAALALEPGNSRYTFYLAQSCRDGGKLDKALTIYQRRTAQGGWPEEAWYARYQCAVLAERLGHAPEQIMARYLAAYQERPTRAEPLVGLARYCRLRQDYHLAYLFAAPAMSLARPDDLLFVEQPCYGWLRSDEYALACYWTQRHEEAGWHWQALLHASDLPASERERIAANLAFAQAALKQAPLPPAAPTRAAPPIDVAGMLAGRDHAPPETHFRGHHS